MRHTQPDPLPEGAMLRAVNSYLHVSFEGIDYDVRPLGVFMGDTVVVAHSKTFEGEVCALVESGAEHCEVVLKRSNP